MCNFAGFCPAQSPDDFSHLKPSHDGKDLDNVIFKPFMNQKVWLPNTVHINVHTVVLSLSYDD